MHIRRCTHELPIFRHSSQPAMSAGSSVTSIVSSPSPSELGDVADVGLFLDDGRLVREEDFTGERAAVDLLGRHVRQRADDRACFRFVERACAWRWWALSLTAGGAGRDRTGEELGDAEVEDLHLPCARDDDVVGLEVAVNDVRGMRGLERA